MQHNNLSHYNSYCTNEECVNYTRSYTLAEFPRCPVCNEPSQLLPEFLPKINPSGASVYEKYFDKKLLESAGSYKEKLIQASLNIGFTPIKIDNNVAEWADIPLLYLKDETVNPSGSFKERGTWTAVALHLENGTPLTIGTVSTGNMAISTAYMTAVLKDAGIQVNSFIVVDEHISQKKLDLIQKAAGKAGTTIFVVKGNYALFHDVVYLTCARLREKGKHVYAELTDDVFRLTGYATVFTEIVDQLKSVPDFVIVPVASGGLFRVALWTFAALKNRGIIDSIPHVVLVQEKGADPIVQAYDKNQQESLPISIESGVVAQAIDVSNSRSGTASLKSVKEGFHLCIAVTADEIKEALKLLYQQEFYVEEAGAVAVAAAKKLREQNKIRKENKVVALLTGKEPTRRDLYQQSVFKNTVIHCSLEELPEKMMATL